MAVYGVRQTPKEITMEREEHMASILIVDDSRTSRRILKNILEEQGHKIAGEACNGQEAVELYFRLKPEVVTMDITMPVMDGLVALQAIREKDDTAKVIMITAAGQKEKMTEAVKFGAAEFLTKPFAGDEVLSVVERVAGA